MTDQPCLEVPFDEVEKWEKIEGSCARLYAAAEWGYKQALATPPPEPTDEELLRLYGVATPCYHVEEFKRELNFVRAALEMWGHG